MRFLLTTILAFFILQISFAQEIQKAILHDEISQTNCCDLDSRTDQLIQAVKEVKDSKGYIIIYYTKDTLKYSLYFERVILSTLFYQDIKNITVIRRKSEDRFKTQFWFAENGAKIPFSITDEVDFTLLNPTKPISFTNTMEGSLCSERGYTKQFAEILLANPNLNGNLVIYAKSKTGFLKSQKSLQDELSNIYQVPKTKLRFFFFKNNFDYVEYWLVPKKQNH